MYVFPTAKNKVVIEKMQKRNLTRRQKIFVAQRGLKPENWYIVKETDEYYQLVSKNGQSRLLWKDKQ